MGAFIWFQYLNFSPALRLSANSCIHSLGLKTSPLAPQQLFACIFIWFQRLGFPPCLSTTSCAHLVSISNFRPPPMCLSSNASTSCIDLGFNIYASPRAFTQLLAFIWFQYLNFPPGPPQQLPAFIWFHIWFPRGLSTISCMHLVSISKAHPHLCLSTTSCIHAVSISKLSPSSLHNFLHASWFGFNV